MGSSGKIKKSKKVCGSGCTTHAAACCCVQHHTHSLPRRALRTHSAYTAHHSFQLTLKKLRDRLCTHSCTTNLAVEAQV